MKLPYIYCAAFLFVLLAHLPAAALSQHDHYSVEPAPKPDGSPWRIAYLEGGEYQDYAVVLKNVADYLARWGWFEKPVCLDTASGTMELWDCLSEQDSPYIDFLADAYWSADWNTEERKRNRAEIIDRLNRDKDIDVVIAMGTWAGQDLATNEHSTPTIAMSTSNAIESDIIESAEDSGRDHVHARVDPLRYYRQVRFFHEIVEFETLGVVYENTVEGHSYAGMNSVKKAAEEFGFSLRTCEAPLSRVTKEEAENAVVECHRKLAREVDALYITINRGVNPQNMPRLLEPLFRHNIPNFAMGTLYEVKQGGLMSMAQPDFDHLNRFWAMTMAKVMNGATPRLLTQIKEDPHKIAINLQAARMLGFDFPLEVLGGAETIYETIEPAPAP